MVCYWYHLGRGNTQHHKNWTKLRCYCCWPAQSFKWATASQAPLSLCVTQDINICIEHTMGLSENQMKSCLQSHSFNCDILYLALFKTKAKGVLFSSLTPSFCILLHRTDSRQPQLKFSLNSHFILWEKCLGKETVNDGFQEWKMIGKETWIMCLQSLKS